MDILCLFRFLFSFRPFLLTDIFQTFFFLFKSVVAAAFIFVGRLFVACSASLIILFRLSYEGLQLLWLDEVDNFASISPELRLILPIGGALLITPGFFTDFIGFCCLIPQTRRLLIRHLLKPFSVKVHTSHTIEGEFQRWDHK